MWPNLCQIKRIPSICFSFYFRHYLNRQFPTWEIPFFYRFKKLYGMIIRIFACKLVRYLRRHVFYTLFSLEMKFYPESFVLTIDKTECMAAITVHERNSGRNSPIRKQYGHLM